MIARTPPEYETEAAEDPQEETKSILRFWIPATLVVGLLIAAAYLGGRILTSHSHAKKVSSPPLEHIVAPAPAPAPVKLEVKQTVSPPEAITTPPAPSASTEAPAPAVPAPASAEQPMDYPVITPEPGQHYIQVGALNSDATRRFVTDLRKKSFDPHVAPGPTPELNRVLIGPFANLDELDKTKAQLRLKGIPTFVRRY